MCNFDGHLRSGVSIVLGGAKACSLLVQSLGIIKI
jgi:hypothetical protein